MRYVLITLALVTSASLGTAKLFAADEAPAVAPEAVTALTQMGAYLRTLKQFAVIAESRTDYVDDDSSLLSFALRTELKVVRPDRMRAVLRSDGGTQTMVYDGKNFTLHGTQHNYYATVPAPPTLRALSDDLTSKYGIETPLADLFYWGTEGHDGRDLTGARKIGDEKIEGFTCTHYAYRQEGVDWQLWVRTGAQPLPCQLIITDRTQAERPQHAVRYQWQTAPSFAADTFRFVPPKGAGRITLVANNAVAVSSSATGK